MKKWVGYQLLRLMGWKLTGSINPAIDKFVLIAAPHTSNMDFFLAIPSLWALGVTGRYLIKKELFWFPLNLLLRLTGGIPVDRKNKKVEFVDQLKDLLNSKDRFAILFTPEGTRSRVERWKTGFYRVAKSCNIPVVLAYADYEKKEVHCGETLYPTDDFEADFEKLEEYYSEITACYPEKFNRKFFVMGEKEA